MIINFYDARHIDVLSAYELFTVFYIMYDTNDFHIKEIILMNENLHFVCQNNWMMQFLHFLKGIGVYKNIKRKQ